MDNKILHSVIGTTVAEIITIPICTIKTIYQTSNYRNPIHVHLFIYNRYGIKGYYHGTAPAVFSQIVSCSSKYTFYNIFKSYRSTESSDLLNNSINGMCGGVFGSICSHPFDVIKNYHQRGLSIKGDLNDLGPILLYRGYTQNFYKNILLYSMLYPIYDLFKSHDYNPFCASICTSLFTTLILQPVDLLKVRKIANKSIFLGWNPLLYYRGYLLNVMRVIPHFTITMCIIEWLNNKKN